jgi:hypothetical protein
LFSTKCFARCHLFSLVISSRCFAAAAIAGGSSCLLWLDALPPWLCFSIGNQCDDVSFFP